MNSAMFRQTIPQPWHVAQLTAPPGESADVFGQKIERHLTTRLSGQSWAWGRDPEGSGRVGLATPELEAMPVVLAHLLGALQPVAAAGLR